MSDSKTKKEELLDRFDFARKQNLDLIHEIEQYAKEHDAYDIHFMQGYSFNTSLETLGQERDLIFNDEYRMVVLNAEENSSEFDFLIRKIEEQINHYGEIKMGLNVYFKGLN